MKIPFFRKNKTLEPDEAEDVLNGIYHSKVSLNRNKPKKETFSDWSWTCFRKLNFCADCNYLAVNGLFFEDGVCPKCGSQNTKEVVARSKLRMRFIDDCFEEFEYSETEIKGDYIAKENT